jgi:hypothetical protein
MSSLIRSPVLALWAKLPPSWGDAFVLIEQNPKYVTIIRNEAKRWLGHDARHILTLELRAY